MAKILYAIMGNTHGHIMRTKSILARWKKDDAFYIVGGGRVPDAFSKTHPVLDVPVLRTVHRKQSVAVGAVVGQIARRGFEMPRMIRQIRDLIEKWQPDFAICDREFFTPFACRAAGLPCVSVDHSHLLIDCRYPVPPQEWLSWSLAMLNDRLFFNSIPTHAIVSFFHPPLKYAKARLFGPVLRPNVLEAKPQSGNHILVYQTSPTFTALIDTLSKLKRPSIVYGFKNEYAKHGPITFKPYDSNAILEDLATSAYAIANGGHNLICEALFLRKPLFCFPIANHFEQFINSYYVRELGYGDYSTSKIPDVSLFDSFERRLDFFYDRLNSILPDSTDELVEYLQSFTKDSTILKS